MNNNNNPNIYVRPIFKLVSQVQSLHESSCKGSKSYKLPYNNKFSLLLFLFPAFT